MQREFTVYYIFLVFVIVNILIQRFGLYICFLKSEILMQRFSMKVWFFNLYFEMNDTHVFVNWKDMQIVIMSKKSFFWTYVMNTFYEEFRWYVMMFKWKLLVIVKVNLKTEIVKTKTFQYLLHYPAVEKSNGRTRSYWENFTNIGIGLSLHPF